MNSKLLLKNLQVKESKRVWLESVWLECEVSRRMHREEIIEHRDSTSRSDHKEEIALAQ